MKSPRNKSLNPAEQNQNQNNNQGEQPQNTGSDTAPPNALQPVDINN